MKNQLLTLLVGGLLHALPSAVSGVVQMTCVRAGIEDSKTTNLWFVR